MQGSMCCFSEIVENVGFLKFQPGFYSVADLPHIQVKKGKEYYLLE